MTRILHLRSSIGLYGAEQVILNLARELEAIGCSNHIVCIVNMKNPHRELLDEAMNVGLSTSAVECRAAIDLRAINQIRTIIRRHGIDVIHCHDYKSCVLGLWAARGLHVKQVITNHLWTRSNLRLRAYHVLEGLLYNRFDKVVAVSEAIAEECRPFLWRKDKLTFIPNGIDLHRFTGDESGRMRHTARATLGLAEGDLVVGNMARLSPEKDHATLLRAFKLLTEMSPEHSFKLLVAGDGPEEANLRALAQELAVADRCLFVGFRSDVPRLLNCMDVYVQSSKREGLPMIILEAMAAAVPIVSTKAGGITDVITDGAQGRLVDIGDERRLARVLNEVLSDADERKKLGRRARRSAEAQFSARVMAERYLDVYTVLTRP